MGLRTAEALQGSEQLTAEAAGLGRYLHGASGGPSASGVPEPLLAELRMSEVLGAGTGSTQMR